MCEETGKELQNYIYAVKYAFSKIREACNYDSSMIVYYHDDADGVCSAAILRARLCPSVCDPTQAFFFPIDYNKRTYDLLAQIRELDKTYRIKTIVFVDFTPPRNFFEYIPDEYVVIVIDHHQTAIRMMIDCPISQHIVFLSRVDAPDMDEYLRYTQRSHIMHKSQISACELTWMVCNYIFDEQKAFPPLVYLLGRADVYDFCSDRILGFKTAVHLKIFDEKLGSITLEETVRQKDILPQLLQFSYLIKLGLTDNTDTKEEIARFVEDLLTEGITANKVLETYAKGIMEECSYTTKFKDVVIRVLNCPELYFNMMQTANDCNVLITWYERPDHQYEVEFRTIDDGLKTDAWCICKDLVTLHPSTVVGSGGYRDACGAIVRDIDEFLCPLNPDWDDD